MKQQRNPAARWRPSSDLLPATSMSCRRPCCPRGARPLSSRVTKHPKVHLADPGVMAWLLNRTPQKIAQAAPTALTEYGSGARLSPQLPV
jgi:hypothetical protein